MNKRKVWERDNWTCFYCKRKVVEHKTMHLNSATVDHVVPRAKGGSGKQDNLITACLECNQRKGTGDFRPYFREGTLVGVSRGQSILN